ncbi:MAG: hypothetical protein LBN36_01425, partial [Clostridiales Family XIII bacterium]|nr:hypothetical protein [Clostridiales Family XIII bacterium]
MKYKTPISISLIALLLAFSACGASPDAEGSKTEADRGTLVVYTAVDQIFSEPVLKDFEAQTGIKVEAVYDMEANKTTGLVNRILAEKEHPVCDVFWNNEFVQTIR